MNSSSITTKYIKDIKKKTNRIFTYEEISTNIPNMNRDMYYDIMKFMLNEDGIIMHVSKWKELDFIEYKSYIDNNPLTVITTLKFIDNKIIMSSKIVDVEEEYGFK